MANIECLPQNCMRILCIEHSEQVIEVQSNSVLGFYRGHNRNQAMASAYSATAYASFPKSDGVCDLAGEGQCKGGRGRQELV